LIYWGYVYPGKGIETLLRAFQIVSREDSNVRLVLVGGCLDILNVSSSDYFQMVQRLPEELKIAEKLTWTLQFQWDSDTGSRYLHAGDVCVLPFDFGATLNNSSLAAASTHGLPVISTELPEGRDEALQHGRNIYLCPPRNPEALAEAIRSIKGNALLRERLRAGAGRLAQDWYQPGIVAKRLSEVLESTLAARPALAHQARTYTAAGGETTRKEGRPADPLLKECEGVYGDNLRLSPLVWPEQEVDDDAYDPLLSVIVAVYDVEGFLSQCLDSLIHQTLKNIEIIAVNDASADGSLGILEEYKSRYPQLRVVTCAQNKGLASVRNIGLRAARGRYVAFLDGDDWADVRMGEVMVRRASRDDADVLIANVTVFYEDSKTFGDFFDYHVRESLAPQLRTTPFHLCREPRILLLEPVAWPKIYKRAFLRKHDLHFEAGMNSYEDICFHFSVLLKATRISLIDDALFFYRQNRPGQISGRTDRRVFEVFAVFEKIRENLTAWEVPAEIWALLVKVQVRQFDWLLRDRVQPQHKQEFLAAVKEQFRMIPEGGFEYPMKLGDLAKLLCMRQNWLRAYETLAGHSWPIFLPLYLGLYRVYRHEYRGRSGGLLRKAYQRGHRVIRRKCGASLRSFLKRARPWAALGERLQTIQERLDQLTALQAPSSPPGEPFVEPWRIKDHVVILSEAPSRSGLADVVLRVKNDYYLSNMAVFREGDTVVDIGAHVGVMSIKLAKTFPFIKVYAIEPDTMNYACLRRNLELNGLTNVTAINTVVSGDGTKKRLYVDASDSTWATTDARLAWSRGPMRTAEVESVTLEELFHKHDIRHCRLLKITAPGSVLDILKQFGLSRCVDLLCGEVDSEDCSLAKLEIVSWGIARQHFWRIRDRQVAVNTVPWIQQLPTGCEYPLSDLKTPMRASGDSSHV
jgi:FkbM family methyltransferase